MMASLISSVLSGNDPLIAMMNMCPLLTTPVDWKETPQCHVFIADLPGLGKEDVKVEIDDNRVLQISGKSRAEKEECAAEDDDKKKREKWHRVERNRGEFCRRFRLPENAKVDQVRASMENGVLTVTVPKQEVKKLVSKVIEIQHK